MPQCTPTQHNNKGKKLTGSNKSIRNKFLKCNLSIFQELALLSKMSVLYRY
jgi:hypothetical protein